MLVAPTSAIAIRMGRQWARMMASTPFGACASSSEAASRAWVCSKVGDSSIRSRNHSATMPSGSAIRKGMRQPQASIVSAPSASWQSTTVAAPTAKPR